MVWHPPSEWPRFHEIPRGFGCLELYVRLTDDVEVKLKWLLSLRVRPMAVDFKKGKIWRLWPGWCVNQSFLGMPEGLIRSLRGVFHAFSHISHHSTASGPHNQNKGWCTTKTEYVVNRSVWCCFCKNNALATFEVDDQRDRFVVEEEGSRFNDVSWWCDDNNDIWQFWGWTTNRLLITVSFTSLHSSLIPWWHNLQEHAAFSFPSYQSSTVSPVVLNHFSASS